MSVMEKIYEQIHYYYSKNKRYCLSPFLLFVKVFVKTGNQIGAGNIDKDTGAEAKNNRQTKFYISQKIVSDNSAGDGGYCR